MENAGAEKNLELLIFQPRPALPPPPRSVGVVGWARVNLFNGWAHSLLTLAAVCLLIKIAPPLLSWACSTRSGAAAPRPVRPARTAPAGRLWPTNFAC